MPFYITLFTLALAGLSFYRTHLLSALLCLEAMMLVAFITLALWPSLLSHLNLVNPLVMLTFSACEAALGLSLMVAIARFFMTSSLRSLSLLQ
uniref:NADH-ubiquinone oxidoreductase chain 4L n=1 Tax=Phrynoglossus myanhessei TaxID=2798809 RepID=A0A8A0WQ78_9NEOB|nr:NADH dehydrogenase subunit 4L [Phrynoglossus myanhessei]QSQ72195.1 NADH dehydrogenase subunit 4L [Phrynoglossus myanhessei]